MCDDPFQGVSLGQARLIIRYKEPKGLFISKDVTRARPYIGIDNLTRPAHVEEFSDMKDCLRWIIGIAVEVDRQKEQGLHKKIDRAQKESRAINGKNKTSAEAKVIDKDKLSYKERER